MARRRSLNRRRSRRSSNLELDQDSEVVDTENVMWWKNIQSTLGPSAQNSFAETTGSILDERSLIDGSELQDGWWDNLDRTNIQSSRRFSKRRSSNLENPAEQSPVADGSNDVSTKKPRIELLEATTRQSGAKDSFGKVSNDSMVAHSEPMPSTSRKIHERSTNSDAEQRKMSRSHHSRHSRSFADVERANVSSNTSNVARARPKSFGKYAKTLSSTAYDDVLANESLRINFGTNLSRISDNPAPEKSPVKPKTTFFEDSPEGTSIEGPATTEKTVDPHKSVLARSVTATQREELSRISKKLHMSSDESPSDADPNKTNENNQKQLQKNISSNRREEILTERSNENAAAENAAETSHRPSRTTSRTSKSLRDSQRISTRENAREISSDLKTQLRESDGRTIIDEAMSVEEEMERLHGNSQTSKKFAKTTIIEENDGTNEWAVPETQETPRKLHNRTKNSTVIQESMDAEEFPEDLKTRGTSLSVSKANLEGSKKRTRDATMVEEAIDDEDSSSDDRKKSSKSLSTSKANFKDSKRRTRDATMIEEPMKDERSPKNLTKSGKSLSTSTINLKDSKRRTRDATIVEEPIDDEDSSDDRKKSGRSLSTSKINLLDSKRRTRDATIVEEPIDDEDSSDDRKKSATSLSTSKVNLLDSKRRTRDATIVKEPMEDLDSSGDHERSSKSLSTSKVNLKDSKRNTTRNATIVEQPFEDEDYSEDHKKSGKSLSTSLINSKDSKRRTRGATIVEDPMEDERSPKNLTKSGKSLSTSTINLKDSKRRTRDPTIVEDPMDDEDSSEDHRKSGKSLSTSTINLKDSKRRTRDPTIFPEPMEDEDSSEDHKKSGKSFSTSKANLKDSKRRTKDSTIFQEPMEDEGPSENRKKSGKSLSTSTINIKDAKRRTRDATIVDEPMEDEESLQFATKSLKSSTAIEENPRGSKFHVAAKNQSARSIQPNNLSRGISQDWESDGESEDEDVRTSPKPSTSSRFVSNEFSFPNKISSVLIGRLSRARKSQSQREIEESKETTRNHENSVKIRKTIDQSRKSRSRILPDSAYELPDMERSDSVIISSSDEINVDKKNTSNTSLRRSSRRDGDSGIMNRKSEDRSIVDGGTNLTRRKFSEAREISRTREDLDESVSETESPVVRKSISRKSIANTISLSHQRQQEVEEEDSDQSISEEMAIPSPQINLNQSRKNYRVDNKIISKQIQTSKNTSMEINSNLSRKHSRIDDKMVSKKIEESTNQSREDLIAAENISEAETEIADNEISRSPERNIVKSTRTKSFGQSSRISRVAEELPVSDGSVDEKESNLPPKKRSTTDSKRASGKNVERSKASRRKTEAEETNENENAENKDPRLEKNSNEDRERTITEDVGNFHDSTNNNPSISTIVTSTTIPSESVPIASNLSKLAKNADFQISKNNATAMQKNITDFFPSTLLKKFNNSKTPVSLSSLSKEELDEMKKAITTQRMQMAAVWAAETSKPATSSRRTENSGKMKNLISKENTSKGKAKVPKVVNKAYIVNGQVYKRPKLPRPKPWATDRLYRHLWKKMEPKYGIRTRVKSEKFVEQLAEVVALTVRRKKYENYKKEVDALVMEMARLDIVKTRHDFYDFCYDYLPYDFRVKVTPMIHPGSVRIVPYDPETMDTPILPESGKKK